MGLGAPWRRPRLYTWVFEQLQPAEFPQEVALFSPQKARTLIENPALLFDSFLCSDIERLNERRQALAFEITAKLLSNYALWSVPSASARVREWALQRASCLDVHLASVSQTRAAAD